MSDLSHVRGDHPLYLRSIDKYGNVKIEEVVSKGVRGKNLVLMDQPGSFLRTTGELNGKPEFDYLPDAKSWLMERTAENAALFEKAKAGLLPPVMPLEEAKLRCAVAWLKNEATYEQVVAVASSGSLLAAME